MPAIPLPAAPDHHVHIVGWWNELLAVLRLRAPYAKCGKWLGTHDPAELDLTGPDSPICPACEQANGRPAGPWRKPGRALF